MSCQLLIFSFYFQIFLFSLPAFLLKYYISTWLSFWIKWSTTSKMCIDWNNKDFFKRLLAAMGCQEVFLQDLKRGNSAPPRSRYLNNNSFVAFLSLFVTLELSWTPKLCFFLLNSVFNYRMATVSTFLHYYCSWLQVNTISSCGFLFWKRLIHSFWIIFVAAGKFWWRHWLFEMFFMKSNDFLLSILEIPPKLPLWCRISLFPVFNIDCFILGLVLFCFMAVDYI